MIKLGEIQDIEQFNKIGTMAMNDEYLSNYQLFDLGSRFIKFEISTVTATAAATTNYNITTTSDSQWGRIRKNYLNFYVNLHY